MSPPMDALALTALLAVIPAARAGLDLSAATNVAVYWGQNSYGESSGDLAQQRLSHYCNDENIDSLQLSFLTMINGAGGSPEVNFANQGDKCEVFEGTNLLDCPEMAEDIATCQGQGKTIILSIGGATYTEGGFGSEDEAIAGAELVWNTFGPPNPDSDVPRTFGDSSVDGFDLDFEAVVTNMVPFANRLRELMDADSSTKRFLTAAPQCPYPDQANDEMLNGAVSFDAIWVQFYNNFCGLDSFQPGSDQQDSFNLATWDDWAANTSKNKDVKVLVGAPANTGAAGSGYVPPDTLAEIITYSKGFGSFGGVMMWDATQAYANDGFLAAVKTALTSSAAKLFRKRYMPRG